MASQLQIRPPSNEASSCYRSKKNNMANEILGLELQGDFSEKGESSPHWLEAYPKSFWLILWRYSSHPLPHEVKIMLHAGAVKTRSLSFKLRPAMGTAMAGNLNPNSMYRYLPRSYIFWLWGFPVQSQFRLAFYLLHGTVLIQPICYCYMYCQPRVPPIFYVLPSHRWLVLYKNINIYYYEKKLKLNIYIKH